jgi:CubicO group peptidase (beta-lactamase class C family)
MSALDAYRDRLDGMLAELAAENRVPGAVCGLQMGDDVHVSAWGVANAATGTPVGPDTLFQIGSITKVYTATLAMQAVVAGVISLDEPVRAQLQEFMVADPAATIEITPRHLLAHTSGLEGDHLIDTGWNADALSRYVATLAGLAQIHPTDQAYSFCNTGYGVVGRLLEVATGEDYDRVLRRRLTRPLGCRATVTLPHHALLHNVAVGHVQAPGEAPVRQSRWVLTRSNGPMGGVMAPAGELLDFARMHLAEGRGPDGTDLLAPVAAATMQHPQVESPVPGEEQALGWTVRQWGDLTCLGQDADTFGQRAVLRVVPERDLAVCVMANSQMGATVAQGVLEGIATELLDVPADLDPAVARPDPDADDPGPGGARADGRHAGDGGHAPAGTVADLSGYSGAYERLHQRIVATSRDGRVRLATEPSGVLQALGVRHVELDMAATGVDVDGNIALAGVDPATGGREVAVLVPPAGGQPPGLYLAGRLHRRVR